MDPDPKWRADTAHPQQYCPLAAKEISVSSPGGDGGRAAEWRVQRETGAEDDGDAAIRSEEPVQTLPAHHQGAASAVLHHHDRRLLVAVSRTLARLGPGARPPPFQSPPAAPCANPRVVPWLPWHVVIGAGKVLMAGCG
jgi:hypothetical protein